MPKTINAKEAYDAGVKAKRMGFGRVTPYYNQPRSDYWWLAGFDGVEFFQAEEKQPEFSISNEKLMEMIGRNNHVIPLSGAATEGVFGTIGTNADGTPSLTIDILQDETRNI